jgi:hypothetical protein
MPLLPTDSDLFFQSATNNFCINLAERLVDAGTTPLYTSNDVQGAIHGMTNTLMGLADNDPREPTISGLLNSHYMTALGQMGSSPTLALRSAFVLACTSPLALASGL